MIQEEMRHNLETCILPFWKSKIDRTNGGYYGLVTYNLETDTKAVKGCILNSRILWFFSSAYLTLGDESLLPYAKHAYTYLRDVFTDHTRGGVYWSVTYDGKPYDTTKHTYNMAFAIYALSAYYDATRDEEAIALAKEIYTCIEERCHASCGYLEAFTLDFDIAENDKLSENNVIADMTMNTLLHICEAYTELYRMTGDEGVKSRLIATVYDFLDWVYEPELHRLGVFFDKEKHSILDLHSYGHDIEASWLVDRALTVLNDPKLTADIRPMLLDLADRIYNRAYVNHSVLAECERGVDLTTRIWWVQCESIIGFYNAYQETGEERYRDAAEDIWKYTKEHIVDSRVNSEWLNEVNAEGIPDETMPLLSEWKCPYHNGRACIELMNRTRE